METFRRVRFSINDKIFTLAVVRSNWDFSFSFQLGNMLNGLVSHLGLKQQRRWSCWYYCTIWNRCYRGKHTSRIFFFSLCFALLITRWFKGASFIWSNMLQADCEIIELQISPCCLMSTRGSFHPIPAPKKVRTRRASHATSFRNTLVLLHPIERRLPLERHENLGKSQLRLFTSFAASWNKPAIGLNDFFCCGCDCLSIAYRALQRRQTFRHLRDHCDPLVTNKSTRYAVCHRRVITSHIGKDKPLCLSESASPHRSTFFFLSVFL